MAHGDIICLVNRTSRNLSVTKDGRQIVLKPGENHINSDLVRFAKRQNPVMGSQDPYNPAQCDYLVGVKGTHDDIYPIPDEVLDALPRERIDRSLMPLKDRDVIERRTSGFPRGRAGVSLNPEPAPGGGGFTGEVGDFGGRD